MCTIWIWLYILMDIPPSYSSFMKGQVRNETLRYLYSVGRRYLEGSNPSPLKYMNDRVTGWLVTDKLVKEVVTVVCGDYPYDGESGSREIKVGCNLFERITVHYLAHIGSSNDTLTKSITYCTTKYPDTDYTIQEKVSFAKVRDLVPSVCKKLDEPGPVILNFYSSSQIANARHGCRLLNDMAADYLTVLQFEEGGPNLETYKHRFNNTPNRPGVPVVYVQVSQLLPIVCEGYVVPSMRESCSFFHIITGDLFSGISGVLTPVHSTSNSELDPYDAVLKVEKKSRRQTFHFHRAKPFFIHYCRNTRMRQTEKRTCRYLLNQHVELLVKNPETVFGHGNGVEDEG